MAEKSFYEVLTGSSDCETTCPTETGDTQMAHSIKAAGFVVEPKNGFAIYGIGATEDEAWADVVDAVGYFQDRFGNDISPEEARETQFDIVPATAALMQKVRDEGGQIGWTHVDGIACTDTEEEYGE